MTWMRLKHACLDPGQYGYNIPASEYVDHGVRLVRTTDLATGSLSGESDGIYVPPPVPAVSLLHEGDLLLSRSGTIGRAFLVPAAAEGMTFAGFLVRFRHRPGVDPRFLYYATQSQSFQDQVQADAVTSTIQNFNADRYANVSIWCPSHDAQKSIADFLDEQVSRIDEAVRLRREQIEATTSRHQALLDSLALPQRLGGTVPDEGVEERSLRSLCDFFSDGDWIESPFIQDEGVRLIQTGNVGIGEFKDQGFRYVSQETFVGLRCTEVFPGDVLISRLSPPVSRACLAPDLGERMISSVDVVIARQKADTIRADYLIAYLSTQRHLAFADIMARGSTMLRLSRSQVGSLRITVPPLAIQEQVAERVKESLAARNGLRSEMTAQVALLEERKRSLITAAVTGEFDVTTASGRGIQ